MQMRLRWVLARNRSSFVPFMIPPPPEKTPPLYASCGTEPLKGEALGLRLPPS